MRFAPSLPSPPIRLLAALAASAMIAGCSVDKNSILAPSDAVIGVDSPVEMVPANASVTVNIRVTRPDGSPVRDGTEVFLRATRGTLSQVKVRTRDGVAAVAYRSDNEPGIVELEASSSEARGTMELAVTSAPVAQVKLTANPAVVPGGGATNLEALVVSGNGSAVAGAPVYLSANAGTVEPTTRVLTDGSGKARARLTIPAAGTAAVVSARAGHFKSENVTVQIADPIRVVISASPASPTVGTPVTFTLTPSVQSSGQFAITYGDGQSQNLGAGARSKQAQHVYSVPGTYKVTATFTASGAAGQGTMNLTVRRPSDPPAPPAPPPGPGVPFSLGNVRWLHTNVSGWRETSRITSISITSSQVCIDHTKSGRWPVRDGVEGNPWVFAQINGQWYAATYEWLRPGQTCKGVTAGNIGAHTKQPPMQSWRPKSGELVGFMVSAHARFGQQSVAERSNIVMVRWP